LKEEGTFISFFILKKECIENTNCSYHWNISHQNTGFLKSITSLNENMK
jgi:hypothetical protein